MPEPSPSRLPKLPANPYVIVAVSVGIGFSAGLAVSAWLDSRKPPCPCTEHKLPVQAQGSATVQVPPSPPTQPAAVPVPTEKVFDHATATVVERPIPADGTGPDPVP